MTMNNKRSFPMKTKLIVLVPFVIVGLSAQAKTDTGAAIEQMKVNETNAKANYKQYQENVDIASKNIDEVSAAIKQLHDQKTQLVSNAQNLEKNRAVVDKMKEKLAEHSKEESALLKKEDEKIAALQATLAKMQANKKQRED